jgi:hypothetical protein
MMMKINPIFSQVKKMKEGEEGFLKKYKIPCYKKIASKIICYNYKEMGHYSTQCPLKHEKGKKMHHAYTTDVEEKKSNDEEYVFHPVVLPST